MKFDDSRPEVALAARLMALNVPLEEIVAIVRAQHPDVIFTRPERRRSVFDGKHWEGWDDYDG